MADHRNQGTFKEMKWKALLTIPYTTGASSSSRLVRELNNISFPSELDLGSVASSVRSTPPPNSSQPRKSISRRHVAKGKEKEHRPPQSDTIDSIQPPHQRNRQVDEASSIASPSKRARQSESPEVAAAKRTKKPRPATSKKDRVYDDNVNIFAHHDPLARELDISKAKKRRGGRSMIRLLTFLISLLQKFHQPKCQSDILSAYNCHWKRRTAPVTTYCFRVSTGGRMFQWIYLVKLLPLFIYIF